MSDDIAIRVEHVSKDFILPHEKITSVKGLFLSAFRRRKLVRSKQHALRDVSFDIKKGEFFGIVGRNGSGKSTMLKMLAGIYQPTHGKIHVNGKLVPFIELGVGFNPELTGRENVYLNGAMMGFSEKQVDAMYDEIVAFAELEEFMDQKLKNYSSGMQVRLAFSVAIKAEADVLLVDEVLAVGDADFQRKCYDYFKSLKKNKKTVVFVTHDMDAVREYCDRALLIEDGVVGLYGGTDDVAEEYLRLFMHAAAKQSFTGTGARWGDGRVTIESVRLTQPTLTAQTKLLRFAMTIEAQENASSLTVGFVIKDGSGVAICGTNTRIKRLPPLYLKTGEHCTLRWECANIFADGEYTIDVAVHKTDGVTIHDWWEAAGAFTVKRAEKTAYRIAPPMEVTIQE